MSPDQILNTINLKTEEDSDLLAAVIAYNYASAIVDGKQSGFKNLAKKGNAIGSCITNLFDRAEPKELENESYISIINQTAKVADIFQLADIPQMVKSIGDSLKKFAESIRIERPKLSLSHLELLVNTRRLNQRLPKQLSSYIKGILDHQVHSLGNYWDNFPELSTLQGQLRKLWIQCISLQLYNYNPDESYTIKRISEIVPSVLQTKNAEVHYLFCRMMHDAGIKSVAISNYDSILDNLIKQTEDKASLLYLNAALLLNKKIEANTSWINKIGTGQPIELPASSEDSRLKTVDSKPYDIQSAIKHHPTWAQHAADFIRLQEKGMTMKEFCQKNRLSEPAFSEFYCAVIKDIEKDIQQDPFLTKLASLPHKVQDEYAELMSRKKDVLERVCEAVSGITGEKVRIEDILNAAENKNSRLDKKMQKALDNLAMVDPRHALKFMTSSTELKRIEAEIDAFLSKHNL